MAMLYFSMLYKEKKSSFCFTVISIQKRYNKYIAFIGNKKVLHFNRTSLVFKLRITS